MIVGAQWGDEGKGKIVDLLAQHSDVVCRYQGGPNAGHTIVADGETYKFRHMPSGILWGKECVLGAGCVIDPQVFIDYTRQIIDADGSLVGMDVTIAADQNIYLYNRSANQVVDIPALRTATDKEVNCVLDACYRSMKSGRWEPVEVDPALAPGATAPAAGAVAG